MPRRYPYSGQRTNQAGYSDLEATELYCPNCRQAMPVRKRLLLVLPEGDKYEYLCARCGTSVGDKIDKSGGTNLTKVLV
jgi:DNA-directed RNA polymerase subunit RPC12/RpoP